MILTNIHIGCLVYNGYSNGIMNNEANVNVCEWYTKDYIKFQKNETLANKSKLTLFFFNFSRQY